MSGADAGRTLPVASGPIAGPLLPLGAGRLWRALARARAGLLPLLLPLAILLLWAVAAQRHWMSPQVLPTPALVYDTARELAADTLFPHLAVSLARLAGGLAAGIALGLLLGCAMGLSRRVEAIIYPTFLALVQIPTLAWIPLLMLLLGLGEALKIVIIIKAVAVPVAVQTHVGVRDLDPRLMELARVLRLGPLARFRRLLVPSLLPASLTGFRLGLAQAWVTLVAVELMASSEGIGFLMVWGRQLFQLDIVFVCIIVIGAVGLVMDLSLTRLQRALVYWPARALAERRRGGTGTGWGWTLLLPLALLALWFAAVQLRWVDPRLLPGPGDVAFTLWTGLRDGTLLSALGASLVRCAAGLAIGAGAGLAIGLLLGLVPAARLVCNGTFTVLRLVAIFAWLPLITAWAGLGDAAKIAFIAIATFFPMQVSVQQGVLSLSPQLQEIARTLRLPLWARLRYLVLPGCASAIFAGLRLALVASWVATMGAEYFMAGNGIGSFMINAEQLFRTDVVLAGMVVVGLAAAAIAALGQWIEGRATRWRAA